jgi:hypothetical protein
VEILLSTTLLLSNLQLFCAATHEFPGYRQKMKEDVSQQIAVGVASSNIYDLIGRFGMMHPRTGRGTDKTPAGGSSKL